MQSQVTFYKRSGGKFDKTRRDKATKTRKAEKRAMWPQAKERGQPRSWMRKGKGVLLEPPEGAQPR